MNATRAEKLMNYSLASGVSVVLCATLVAIDYIFISAIFLSLHIFFMFRASKIRDNLNQSEVL